MLIGYARTSTAEQVAGLESQQAALAATGCTKLFSEQASSVGQRDQLAAVLDWVRDGDTLSRHSMGNRRVKFPTDTFSSGRGSGNDCARHNALRGDF